MSAEPRPQTFSCVIQFKSEPPSYYDGSYGDPGRTTRIEAAKRYASGASALRAAAQLWRRYQRQWTLVPAPASVQHTRADSA